jgi:hypothetical protein
MQTRTMSSTFGRRLAAAMASTFLAVAAMTISAAWSAPAGASAITTSCGPGIELGNCPPLCSKLLAPSVVSKIFHVRLGKADWHVDGQPQDTCTYAEVSDPNATVSDSIDSRQTVADFQDQVKVAKEFNRAAIVQKVPALGRYSVDIVHCMGSGPGAWCYPEVIALSKGHLVQVGVALGTVDLAVMDKTYVPEIVAWVKALVARA